MPSLNLAQNSLNKLCSRLLKAKLCLVFLLLILGCDSKPKTQTPSLEPSKFNLILISLDTLRADRLKAYGYSRNTSPNIDSFAAKSVVFEEAIAPASWTLPSHVSMFSGLFPTSHGVVTSNKRRLVPETPFLAELLKEKGYQTFAFTGGGYLSQAFGFGKGFDTFINTRLGKPDLHHEFEVATTHAVKAIEALPKDQRFFIFLHTYDVHCPYSPPTKFKNTFSTPTAEYLDPDKCAAKSFEKKGLTRGQVEFISNSYDESILAVDQVFGEFIAQLDKLDALKDTVVMITSDHGEEFNEHGKIGHKASLFKELLLVPLIVYAPGINPSRVRSSVSLVDIAPTALDLLGIPTELGVDGRSLTPLLSGKEVKLRDFQFAELDRGPKLRSSWGDGRHLIINLKEESPLLFDYRKDPLESNNLALSDPDLLAQEETKLRSFISNLKPRQLKPVNEKLEGESKADELKQLETLGYL